MAPRRRHRLAFAACLVVLVAAAFAGGSWLATHLWGPTLARDRIESALAEALGRAVRVESVSIEPWRGRVVVSGIAAEEGPPARGIAGLAVGRVEAHLGISSLWQRRAVLRRLVIEDVAVSLIPTGGPPLAELPLIPRHLRLGPVEVEIGVIELRRARIAYRDPGADILADLGPLDATVQPGDGAMAIELVAGALDLGWGDQRERLSDLRAAGEVRPAEIALARGALTWQGREIRLDGRAAAPLDAPMLALDVAGEIDLAAIARVARAPWPLAGVATVAGAVGGTVAQPTVDGRVTVPRLDAGPVSAERVAIDLRLADGRLSVARASARALGGAVDGALSVDLARLDSLRAEVRLRDGSLAALEPLLGVRTGATARLDLHAEIEGDPRLPERLRGQATVDARAVRIDALARAGDGTASARGRFAGGAIDVASAQASWPGLGIAASGRATLAGPERIQLTASADLASVGPLLGAAGLTGRAALEAELSGLWSAPAATGRLELTHPALAGMGADRAEIPFALAPAAIRVEGASLALGGTRVRLAGRGDWSPSTPLADLRPEHVRAVISVRADPARLEDFARWLPAAARGSGAMSATARIEGTIAAWDATGRLEAAALAWPTAPAVRDLAISFRGGPDRIAITALSARILDAPLTARGSWSRGGAGELRAETGPLDLAGIASAPAWLAPSGRARATVALTARGGALEGTARVTAEQVSVAGLTLGRGTGDVSLLPSGLRADLAFPEARLTASAQGPADGSAPLAVRLSVADVALEPLVARAWPDAAGRVRGSVSIQGDLAVPVSRPEAAQGVVRLDRVRLELAGHALESREAVVVRRDPGQLRLERLELSGASGELSASGVMADAGALQGSVRARLPLGALAALTPEIDRIAGSIEVDLRVSGTRSSPALAGTGAVRDLALSLRSAPLALRVPLGNLSLESTPGDLRATRGALRLQGLEVEVAGEVLKSAGAVVLRREPGRIVLDPAQLAGRVGSLRIGGRLDDAGALDAAVTGRVPLGLLPSLRPEVREASGSIDLDVRVGGRVTAPAVLGTATLHDGLLALRDYPLLVRGGHGRFTFAPGRIRVDELSASLGTGTIRARGDASLDGRALGPYQLELDLRGISGPARPGLETTWDADLELVGRGPRGQLRGEARLVRGLYTRDLALLPLLVERSPGEQAVDVGREIALRVVVKLQDSMVVRTRQASLRAGGTLTVQGTLAAPVLFGVVDAREGTVTFRRNRFSLESATVRFEDPRRIDPLVDVRATTRIRTYDITMDMTGRADDLQIRLSSVPPLAQEDLLALVALGATREELGRSPGTIFAGEAVRILAEQILGLDPASSVVDVFDVDTTAAGGPQVTVGKRLSERTLISYTGSFAEGGQQKLRVEYQLIGPLLVAGEQSLTGAFAADLVLRLRFR